MTSDITELNEKIRVFFNTASTCSSTCMFITIVNFNSSLLVLFTGKQLLCKAPIKKLHCSSEAEMCSPLGFLKGNSDCASNH